MMENSALATLDVADAFLQVPQRVPRKISLDGSEYITLKCLPGQRDASIGMLSLLRGCELMWIYRYVLSNLAF